MLFLKYLDDFEADRAATAKLSGQRYKRILADEYAWHIWAATATDSRQDTMDYRREIDRLGSLFPCLSLLLISSFTINL